MGESVSLAGRTAVVTGAGAGLGRAEALGLAAAGAAVVVNDMGQAAHEVAEEIVAAGGSPSGTAPHAWSRPRSSGSGTCIRWSTTPESCATR